MEKNHSVWLAICTTKTANKRVFPRVIEFVVEEVSQWENASGKKQGTPVIHVDYQEPKKITIRFLSMSLRPLMPISTGKSFSSLFPTAFVTASVTYPLCQDSTT